MSVKTNELIQAASVNAEDYLLVDSPTAGTVRVPLSAAATYFDGALLQPETALSAALSNKANVEMLPNPNLLDNGYFIDPVNGKGQKEYTTIGYTIDRWKIHNGVSSNEFGITLQNDGIRLHMDSFCEYWSSWRTVLEMQRLFGIDGNLTFSILYKGCSADDILYLRVDKNSTEYFAESEFAAKGDGILTFTFSVSNIESDLLSCGIFLKNVGEAIIVAAKLELGSHQTLAHKEGDKWVLNDPPPNKALELTKCQRYQLVIPYARIRASARNNDGFQFDLPIPTTLRAKPTLVNAVEGSTYRITDGLVYSTYADGFSLSVTTMPSGLVSISATKINHGLTDACILIQNMIFDANL